MPNLPPRWHWLPTERQTEHLARKKTIWGITKRYLPPFLWHDLNTTVKNLYHGNGDSGGRRDLSIQYPHGGNPRHLQGYVENSTLPTHYKPITYMALTDFNESKIRLVMMTNAHHHLHGIDLRKPITVWNGVTGDCNSKTAFNWYAVRTKVRTKTPFLKCVIMKGCQYGYQRKGILIGTLDRLAV